MTIDEPMAAKGYQYKHGDRPLDGYTIQRAIGHGGFGEVYYAISDSKKEVALKVINTHAQIELRGTTHCINLKSPHLVTLFDVKYGEDHRPWVIMEYVNGPSLQEIIKAAPSGLGTHKTAYYLREIAKGLTYLHDCGIVHRDLSPSNIFHEGDYVKIGDYGLSKAISATQHSGQTLVVGKLHYMAPEIGDGQYGRTIDIYALGVVLYEMLTGKVPFDGSTWGEVIIKHSQGEVNLDGIAEPYRSVINKAMAKIPADRYQSAAEMVEALCGPQPALESISQFSPPPARTLVPPVQIKARKAANNRGVIWWLTSLTVFVVAVIVVGELIIGLHAQWQNMTAPSPTVPNVTPSAPIESAPGSAPQNTKPPAAGQSTDTIVVPNAKANADNVVATNNMGDNLKEGTWVMPLSKHLSAGSLGFVVAREQTP
jgi:serine/threonine protein kinase